MCGLRLQQSYMGLRYNFPLVSLFRTTMVGGKFLRLVRLRYYQGYSRGFHRARIFDRRNDGMTDCRSTHAYCLSGEATFSLLCTEGMRKPELTPASAARAVLPVPDTWWPDRKRVVWS